jgi:hypothetical protein
MTEPPAPKLGTLKAEFRDPATTGDRKGEITRQLFEMRARLPAGTVKATDRYSQLDASQKAIYNGVLRDLYGDDQIAQERREWALMARRLAMAQGRNRRGRPERQQRTGRPREHHSGQTRTSRGSPDSEPHEQAHPALGQRAGGDATQATVDVLARLSRDIGDLYGAAIVIYEALAEGDVGYAAAQAVRAMGLGERARDLLGRDERDLRAALQLLERRAAA